MAVAISEGQDVTIDGVGSGVVVPVNLTAPIPPPGTEAVQRSYLIEVSSGSKLSLSPDYTVPTGKVLFIQTLSTQNSTYQDDRAYLYKNPSGANTKFAVCRGQSTAPVNQSFVAGDVIRLTLVNGGAGARDLYGIWIGYLEDA